MSRTIRTKVYKFNELSDKAKQVAINWYRDAQSDINALEEMCFDEWCKDKATEKGFDNIAVSYSLSCSQGDGLSFSGDMDIMRFLKEANPNVSLKRLSIISNYIAFKLKPNNRRYCHASKGDVDIYLDYHRREHPNVENIVNRTIYHVEVVYMALCKELEKDGYQWIDDADSDETIIETIEANEYEFYVTGVNFNPTKIG